VDADILSERQVGRTRLIRANDETPLVDPLREILTIATGPVVVLAEELARIEEIESGFLYCSFASSGVVGRGWLIHAWLRRASSYASLSRRVRATQRFSDSNSKSAVGVSTNRRQPAKVMVGWR
jgi:hypothetical protein